MRRTLSVILLGGSLLSADTLVFRNGAAVAGSFVEANSRTVRFMVDDEVKTYRLTDVDAVQFTSQELDPQSTVSGSSHSRLQLPAGTQIVIRMIDSADSARDQLGKIYHASVDRPVLLDGQTIIPRGADAVVALVDLQQSGHLAGRSMLGLDLRSISVDGRTWDLASTSVSQASSSRTARSAKVIGGTAALGAIIGAIAGGGRGAAIGAGSGAALGTGVQVLTSGQRVKIPAETRLSFTLQYSTNLF